MNGKKEEKWMVELCNKRKSLFSNLIFIETDDRKRIDELLRTKPILANYENKTEKWLVLDAWEGFYEHSGTGSNISCNDIDCGNIREYGLRVALPKVQKELENEDTVLVITNIFRTDDQLNSAIHGWSTSNILNKNRCTVIVFADNKNLFPPEILSHIRDIKPPKSTWDERRERIQNIQERYKKYIIKEKLKDKLLDNNGIDNAVRLTAGLNLDQVEASVVESIILNDYISLTTLSDIKTRLLANNPVVSIVQRSQFGFEGIGGYDNLKQRIIDEIINPLKNQQIAKYYCIKPPRGILLFGPPGTGKTILAKSISRETNMSLLMLHPENILGQYVGESEKNFKKAFEIADSMIPCILMIDELDRFSKRDTGDNVSSHVERELFSMLLERLGDENREWFFIGATNLIESIDPALRRTGRIDSVIPVPFPDAKARMEIFRIHAMVKRHPPILDDIDMRVIADKTLLWSGSDIEQMVIRTVNMVMTRDIKNGGKGVRIGMADFLESIKTFNVNVEENGRLQKQVKEQSLRLTNDLRLMDVFDHAEKNISVDSSRLAVADEMIKNKKK